jgi:DnaJ-class molecular chaperone
MKDKRRVYKEDCTICKCSGKVTSSRKRKCQSCKGSGWVPNLDGEPKLCLNCNGDGTVYCNIKCCKCNGFGFNVKIVEILEKSQECRACLGRGHKMLSSLCGKCLGTGYISSLLSTGKRETKRCQCFGKKTHKTITCGICGGRGIIRVTLEKDITPTK